MTPSSMPRVSPYQYSIVTTVCLYLVPFLRYSASNNGVTLKLNVGQGSFKVSGDGTIRQIVYEFVVTSHSNKARYLSKIAPAFDAPVSGPRRNTAIRFGTKKLEWCSYSTVKKSQNSYLAFYHETHRVPAFLGHVVTLRVIHNSPLWQFDIGRQSQ